MESSAKQSAEFWREECERINKDLHKNTDCQTVNRTAYKKYWNNALKGWHYVLMAILMPPSFIISIWITSYFLVTLWEWIQVGFGKKQTAVSTRRKTFVLFICIVGFLIAIFSVLLISTMMKDKAKKVALAKCKLSMIKLKLDNDKTPEYLRECMKTRGYEFEWREEFCLSGKSEEYDTCYK